MRTRLLQGAEGAAICRIHDKAHADAVAETALHDAGETARWAVAVAMADVLFAGPDVARSRLCDKIAAIGRNASQAREQARSFVPYRRRPRGADDRDGDPAVRAVADLLTLAASAARDHAQRGRSATPSEYMRWRSGPEGQAALAARRPAERLV